jgi:hypothetical protein
METKTNLVIDQGATFTTDITLKDDNGDPMVLIGYTANSQMRRWYTSTNTSATFTTSINTTSAVITLSLTSNQTSNIEAGRYVYDCEIANGTIVSRIAEGIVTVTPQVTK